MSKPTMAAVALSFLLATGSLTGQQAAPQPPPDALEGVDVVVLIEQGKEVFGKSAISSIHGNMTYLFSSPENKATFDKAPEKYVVQMDGICARMGGGVTGNPALYAVHDKKIYTFGTEDCRKMFIESPARFIPRPATPMPGGEAEVKGRALINKAAAAHGGAKLDAMTTYTEAATSIQKRPTGDVSIVTKTMWRFPDSYRSERTVPQAQGPVTFFNVITPSEIFGGGGGRYNQPPARLVPSLRANASRGLLPILKARNASDLKVAALEPGRVGDVAVDRVRVVRGGLDVTLNLVPATGRVHSLSYYDRADQGAWADIVIAYDDYRDLDGVLVPFTESATANGTPSIQLSRKLDTAAVNAPLDASLFVRPAGAGK